MRVFACVVATAGAALLRAPDAQPEEKEVVMSLFKKEETTPEMEKAFEAVYDDFLKNFDVDAHDNLLSGIEGNIQSFLESRASTGYETVDSHPRCAGGAATTPHVRGMSAFPGGATKRVFGFDLAKLVEKLASKANGAASASGVFPGILSMQALNMGSGLVKGAISTALQVVPPLVGPPMWINQPLPCMPMATGHNCFGATPYLITAADFMTADVTDSQLDGVIAGFPALYKSKVGTTSDAAYKACFGAYMSMQCASVFPRCQAPMAREEPSPVGRVPLCFTHCLATLVACPGLWLDDIAGECSMVSVPPACTMATFGNFWLLPPQYQNFEDSQPTATECPSVPDSLKAIEASTDFNLYSGGDIMGSPYAAKVPSA